MNEEAIFTALAQLLVDACWERVGDAPGQRRFVTISRKVRLFSDVPAEEQPSAFQAEPAEQVTEVTDMPSKTKMEANWIIYHQYGRDDPRALGTTENSLILDALREVLKPKVGDPGYPKRNTLGGLVHHCYIEGRIFKEAGDLDGQAMLVVPIKLLVP